MSKRTVAGWAALVVAALVTGVVSVKPTVRLLVERSAIKDGPWRTTLTAGAADANPYERTAIAVAGLYALGKQETLYYTAFADSEGRPLEGRCDYTLAGSPLPARWWSLTMYADDNYLVPNAPGIYSRHAGNLAFEPDGSFVVAVSAREQARNWLPAPAGAFSITARLYNPDPAVFADLTKVALPAIVRGSCR